MNRRAMLGMSIPAGVVGVLSVQRARKREQMPWAATAATAPEWPGYVIYRARPEELERVRPSDPWNKWFYGLMFSKMPDGQVYNVPIFDRPWWRNLDGSRAQAPDGSGPMGAADSATEARYELEERGVHIRQCEMALEEIWERQRGGSL